MGLWFDLWLTKGFFSKWDFIRINVEILLKH